MSHRPKDKRSLLSWAQNKYITYFHIGKSLLEMCHIDKERVISVSVQKCYFTY